MATSASPEELACIYCAAILADDDIPITADKISTLLKAAHVDVESIWPVMYAKALSGVNIKDLITNISACSTVAPTTAQSSATGSATKTDEKEEEKKKDDVPADDSDEDSDMGLDLFGD